jgi:hypothetical protein
VGPEDRSKLGGKDTQTARLARDVAEWCEGGKWNCDGKSILGLIPNDC